MSRLAILLACALLTWPQASASAQTTAAAPSRLLVLPFENAGNDPALQWLGEASAVLVADGLRARGLPAISREERVRAFEELHLPLTATLSRATVIKVAQLLGASELITGAFRVQDRQLTVEARTIRVDAGRARPEVSEAGALTDLFAIHDHLVARLAPETATPTVTSDRPPLVAFEDFVKGLVAESPAAKATFLETSLREYPAYQRARLSLWEVRTDQGDHAAALAAARLVPASSPLNTRARFCAATSLINLQRYDEAFAELSSLQTGGTIGAAMRGAIQNNLGVIQIRRGGSAQAGTPVYFLTKATEADPSDADYLFNLGYGYVLDRNYQGAVYWLREALRRDPADADAHLALSVALQGSGSSLEATRERDLARQLSARYEDLARAGADRLTAPKGLERLQMDPDGSSALRAAAIVGTVAQRDQRDQAAFHLARGRRLFEREQDGDALTELRRAVYLSPYEAQAHLLIGKIYLRGGRPEDAIDALKISIWSAETATAHVALAEAYVKTGNARGAKSEAERALAMEPGSADATRILGQIK
jgi:tetratricopeptide (TPR) repeat protein/TolB-like protein